MKTEKIICRILIVDDDDDLCRIMKAILRKEGPIHIEHTLNEAEDHVRQIDPTILFLDNNLPDGQGIDRIRVIKELCPQASIVLMTADTTPNLKELALSEGAIQFIAKPFSSNALHEVVYAICPDLKAA